LLIIGKNSLFDLSLIDNAFVLGEVTDESGIKIV